MGVKMGGNKSLKSPEKGVLRQPRIYSGGNLGQLGKTKTKPKKNNIDNINITSTNNFKK